VDDEGALTCFPKDWLFQRSQTNAIKVQSSFAENTTKFIKASAEYAHCPQALTAKTGAVKESLIS